MKTYAAPSGFSISFEGQSYKEEGGKVELPHAVEQYFARLGAAFPLVEFVEQEEEKPVVEKAPAKQPAKKPAAKQGARK